jgi:hypothetical protein
MNDEKRTSPLLGLLGVWTGEKGIDLAPKPEEDENNPYYETLIIEPVDIDIENAEEQELETVKYYQYIKEIETHDVSHSETGYWIWDKQNDSIMCALAIPRGLSLLAGGEFYKEENGEIVYNVSSNIEDSN